MNLMLYFFGKKFMGSNFLGGGGVSILGFLTIFLLFLCLNIFTKYCTTAQCIAQQQIVLHNSMKSSIENKFKSFNQFQVL